jgi:thiamine pyrophosphokinase
VGISNAAQSSLAEKYKCYDNDRLSLLLNRANKLMRDYLIIANGNFLVSDIIREAMNNKTVIALDGAADKLLNLGITPHIILGDFDSISEQTQHYWGIEKTFHAINEEDTAYQGKHDVTIVPAKNQGLTDLTKAIRYCDQQGCRSITLICALGGRLGHHEGNLRTLRAEYKKQRPLLLHSEQQSVRFGKDESISFSGEVGDKCGMLAYPKAFISSQGLEYEADHFDLQFGFSENTCNALRDEQASIIITGEALVIMPPQLSSQRAFMKKSEAERLELLLREVR